MRYRILYMLARHHYRLTVCGSAHLLRNCMGGTEEGHTESQANTVQNTMS